MELTNNSTKLSSNDQIKLCGYLRKKRNKVGGWCRLWFVLQDRLLVSYKSKEDYYNKLVSFKDALNLMPGTQIRPLEGFRFAIETTTQIIYTFHCDDQNAYREWISKLLNCLTTSVVCKLNKSFCHFSALAHIKTRSFNSIGAEPNVLSRKSNVEQILEQNVNCVYEQSIKRKAVKKHIERMNITGENEYRNENYEDVKKEHRRSKMIAKQSTEKLTTLTTKEQNEDELTISLESKSILENEPVYAVVDLKKKYLRKKRILATQGKRWNSYESIFPTLTEQNEPNEQLAEAIYEDGDTYYFDRIEQEDLLQQPTKVEEENIYEPINVCEHKPALTLRKYISRLTLNPFLRLKNVKTDHKDSRNSTHFDGCTSKKSRFSTIRSKLGVHRKSMQKRIRKLYGNGYEPSPLFQYHNEEVSTTSSRVNSSVLEQAEKLYENQRENTKDFDSLPHFKRAIARITIFNNSPFKSTINQKSKDIKNTERNHHLSYSSDKIAEE